MRRRGHTTFAETLTSVKWVLGGEVEAGETKAEEAQVIPPEDGVSVGSRDTWGCFQVCASAPGRRGGEGRKRSATLFFSHRQLARKSGADDVIAVSLESTLAGTSASIGL